MKRLLLLLAATTAAADPAAGSPTPAPPVASVPLPTPEAAALPDEKALAAELKAAVDMAPQDQAAALAALDTILARLSRQTQLRGLVQFFRAGLLTRDQQDEAADKAIEESILLLPQYPAPLFEAGRMQAFRDQPGKGVDLILRAGRMDARILHCLTSYEAGNLLRRLDEANDRLRAIALSERLVAIGWRNGSPSILSNMAFAVLQARFDSGDISGAQAMIPRITGPSQLSRLLIENKYAPLRAAAEAHAGPALERIWPIHLMQHRTRWEADKDPEKAGAYAGALAGAGHDNTVIETFMPLLMGPLDKRRDEPLIFVAVTVASALGRLGRWDDAFAVLDKALATWPASSSSLSLNLTSNRGRLKVMRGDFVGGLADLDASIAQAATWGPQVNHGAIASMHHYRACALAALGRDDAYERSATIVRAREAVDPSASIRLLLCADDLPAARDVALRALDDEETRPEIIALLRPSNDDPGASDYGKQIAERYERFRADPEVRTRAGRYARIPNVPLNASAPPEAAFAR